jgi:hypothetical protein
LASASKSKRLIIAITCWSLAGTPILKFKKRLRFLWSMYLYPQSSISLKSFSMS